MPGGGTQDSKLIDCKVNKSSLSTKHLSFIFLTFHVQQFQRMRFLSFLFGINQLCIIHVVNEVTSTAASYPDNTL